MPWLMPCGAWCRWACRKLAATLQIIAKIVVSPNFKSRPGKGLSAAPYGTHGGALGRGGVRLMWNHGLRRKKQGQSRLFLSPLQRAIREAL